jgi:hypothetical protein
VPGPVKPDWQRQKKDQTKMVITFASGLDFSKLEFFEKLRKIYIQW